MESIAALVQSVFQKKSLDECSLQDLQNLAKQYPYFTPAQLLLAEKLKSSGDPSYHSQLQKLSLYFNNPLWLDYLLNGYAGENGYKPGTQVENFDTKNYQRESEQSNEPGTEIKEYTTEPPFSKPVADKNEYEAEPTNELQQTQDLIDNNPDVTAGDEFASDDLQNIEFSRGNVEERIDEENQDENADENEPDNTDFVVENSENIEQSNINPAGEANPLHLNLENQQVSAASPITFEPYHTVDYFASQGIRYVPEDRPPDRFAKQLKSFTEWLKTMKRLPQTEIAKAPDPVADQKVQQMAEHSISEEDVITEAMAEVWLKQGIKEKAIEIYDKLSLLNPEKSAYFASLSEQLKNS